VTHPLGPNLGMKLFNEQWFDIRLPTEEPIHEPISVNMRLDGPSSQWNENEEECIPFEMEQTNFLEENSGAVYLWDSINSIIDKLFFIGYVSGQKFRPRWYLVKVASVQTRTSPSVLCPVYTVEYFAKHPNDKSLDDPDSRWWPEWHEYTIGDDGVPEFGRRVLLSPRTKPNPDKFALYSDNLYLSGQTAFVGPFNFDDASTRNKQTIDMKFGLNSVTNAWEVE
jgi:hypothetical protein